MLDRHARVLYAPDLEHAVDRARRNACHDSAYGRMSAFSDRCVV